MHSNRIGFRHWTEEDLALAQTLWGNADVTRLFYKKPLSQEQVQDRLHWEIKCQNAHQIQYWPIFTLEQDKFLGCAGLRLHENAELEFGVHLLPQFWRLGYASEAGSRIIEYALQRRLSNTIMAGHHPENAGSRQTLLKLGLIAGSAQYYEPTGLNHPLYFMYEVPPENVTLREPQLNDVNALAVIHHLSLKSTFAGILDEYMAARSFDYCERGWRKRLTEATEVTEDAHGHNSVALFRGKQIIGFASVSPSQDLDATGRDGELSRIYLHPKVIGQSYGKTLMNWAETALREQNYAGMRLWVFAVNTRARAFYEKMGFALDGAEKEDFGAKIVRYSKTF